MTRHDILPTLAVLQECALANSRGDDPEAPSQEFWVGMEQLLNQVSQQVNDVRDLADELWTLAKPAMKGGAR